MTDIAVIGGGPAGLTAALYAARAGKSVTVFEKECIGGQITRAPLVENYPGLGNVSGLRLGDSMAAQAETAGAEILLAEVQGIKRKDDGLFLLDTDEGPFIAGAVIYAGGAEARTLGLPEEAALVGRGVSYCALCDGAFFQDETVAVVGGGNSAFDDALLLSERCRQVILIHRNSAFRAERIQIERAYAKPNISIMTDTVIVKLHSDDGKLVRLTVEKADGSTVTLAVTGLFVNLGRVPDTELLAGLAERDKNGYIDTDDSMACPLTPGLFAAGDCCAKKVRQVTTAVSDGAIAAVSACAYLEKTKR